MPHQATDRPQPKEKEAFDSRDVQTLISWNAPGRPFQKRGKEFYVTVLLFVFLIEIILFLFSEYQLMLVVLSLTFLSFVLAAVVPQTFHYKISTQGVMIEDHFYIWDELYDFYFKKIKGSQTLIIRTQALLPGELQLPLGDMSKDHIRRVLVQYLPYREVVKPTFVEKSAEWLEKTFPLEK